MNNNQIENGSKVLLPAVFVQTRNEAEGQMKLGNKFTATTWRGVSNFNKRMLRFWMKKYNYTKSKLKRGIDLYEPVSLNGR